MASRRFNRAGKEFSQTFALPLAPRLKEYGSAASTRANRYLESQPLIALGVSAPHMRMHRQADEACPRAAHKTETYRDLRSLQAWQHRCRRQAH